VAIAGKVPGRRRTCCRSKRARANRLQRGREELAELADVCKTLGGETMHETLGRNQQSSGTVQMRRESAI
jgi:hypothetical protein